MSSIVSQHKNSVIFNGVIITILMLFFFTLESKVEYIQPRNILNLILLIICQALLQFFYTKQFIKKNAGHFVTMGELYTLSSSILLFGVVIASLYEVYSLHLQHVSFSSLLLYNLAFTAISAIINLVIVNKNHK